MSRIKNRMHVPALVVLYFCSLYHSAVAADRNKLAILEIDTNSILFERVIKALDLPAQIETRFVTLQDLQHDPASQQFIAQAQVVLVNVMMHQLADYLLEHNLVANRAVYALNQASDPKHLANRGVTFDPEIMAYYRQMNPSNLKSLIRLAVHRHIEAGVDYAPLETVVENGLYHPGAPHLFRELADFLAWDRTRADFQPDRPRVGLLFYTNSLKIGQIEAVNKLIFKLEASGFSVLPCFGSLSEVLERYLTPADNKPPVDMILAFTMKFTSGINDSIRAVLTRLDVPIFNAINPFAETIEEWRASPVGIGPMENAWAVATPEFSGAIEPSVLLGKEHLIDGATGRRLTIGQTVDESIDLLLPRLHNWAKLQRMANRDKRVAILYYNHSQGKQNIGAAYLNVFRSLQAILARMRAEGYAIEQADKLSEKQIQALVMASGRNIGSWATGELDELIASGAVEQVSLEEYIRWFAELPEAFTRPVIAQWGRPEDCAIMTRDGHFVFPMVKLGKVVLLPEPARGWSDDPMKLYHDTTLYPHHQYIAAYLWLAKKFHADAMIHLGTHATYEWLPGKQAGLAPSDPPELMIGAIPNLYPYIVDDIGEGIQAKRRGRGVIIDHLTPPMIEADLDNEYKKIHELFHQYELARSANSPTADVYAGQIGGMAEKLGLAKDLGLAGMDEAALEKINLYLHEIDENSLPFGLHTFGAPYADDAAASTVQLIKKQNPQADGAKVRHDLLASPAREMNNLIRGLNGRYVPAGEGNDPLRNLAAIPTGKNFYGFSPAKVPSRAAWEIGKRAAEEMIQAKRNKEGSYPEKVAVVLWATETSRNEGVNESTVLALMGVEPIWDASGRVVGSRVIPGPQLGRPRIDVLINPSGLYRDMFPEKLIFLDEAVQKALALTDVENYLARNQAAIKQALVRGGMKEAEAEEQSRFRIFTEQTGSYGNGIAEMTSASGLWDKDVQVSDVYRNRVQFAVGGGKWAVPVAAAFTENLRGVDTAVHSRSSNVIGVLDTDDFFMYLGGLSLAVKNVRGQAPDTLVTLHRKKDELAVEDVTKTIGREMRTRYLNPQWIAGMQRDNYGGARQMADFAENLWGWQVTVRDAVDGAKWQQVFEVYVEDKYRMGLARYFEEHNPWAYQSMTARMLETVRKGYWQADEQVVKKLAAEYATNVIRRGVACCDHTCNNPMLNQMVVNIISLPGVLNPNLVEQFKVAIEQMARKSLDDQVSDRRVLLDRLSQASAPTQPAGRGQQPDATAAREEAVPTEAAEGTAAEEVRGYKMEDLNSRDNRTELSSSGIQWAAGAMVLMVLGLLFWGSRRRR